MAVSKKQRTAVNKNNEYFYSSGVVFDWLKVTKTIAATKNRIEIKGL